MDIVLALVLGILIGIAASYRRPIGYLRIDRSDSASSPYIFLELGTPITQLIRSRSVRLKVRAEDFIPHK